MHKTQSPPFLHKERQRHGCGGRGDRLSEGKKYKPPQQRNAKINKTRRICVFYLFCVHPTEKTTKEETAIQPILPTSFPYEGKEEIDVLNNAQFSP